MNDFEKVYITCDEHGREYHTILYRKGLYVIKHDVQFNKYIVAEVTDGVLNYEYEIPRLPLSEVDMDLLMTYRKHHI